MGERGYTLGTGQLIRQSHVFFFCMFHVKELKTPKINNYDFSRKMQETKHDFGVLADLFLEETPLSRRALL